MDRTQDRAEVIVIFSFFSLDHLLAGAGEQVVMMKRNPAAVAERRKVRKGKKEVNKKRGRKWGERMEMYGMRRLERKGGLELAEK